MFSDTYTAVVLDETKLDLLNLFLKHLGNSENTFRYYQSRDQIIIKNHMLTVLFLNNNLPVAYGHLEKDKGMVWLGISVIESYLGMGFGTEMMKYLINYAKNNEEIKEIMLSVDDFNISAIELYKNFNFNIIKQENNTLYFKYSL